MLRIFRYRFFIVVLFAVTAIALAGCGSKQATPTPAQPRAATPHMVQPTSPPPSQGLQIPSPTPQAATTVDMKVVRAAMVKSGCGSCHVIPGIPNAKGTVGPDLTHIATVAKQRISSPDYNGHAKSVIEYLRESIVNPDVYVVPQCPQGPCAPGQMPVTLKQVLTDKELEAIVQYLNTLR